MWKSKLKCRFVGACHVERCHYRWIGTQYIRPLTFHLTSINRGREKNPFYYQGRLLIKYCFSYIWRWKTRRKRKLIRVRTILTYVWTVASNDKTMGLFIYTCVSILNKPYDIYVNAKEDNNQDNIHIWVRSHRRSSIIPHSDITLKYIKTTIITMKAKLQLQIWIKYEIYVMAFYVFNCNFNV